MNERGADQPRHEGGVLDRIPEPEAAPAELVVGPEAPERDAAGEESPGGGGPGPRPAGPGLAELSFEHRRARDRDRDREAHIARLKYGRMHRQRRVLGDRIQVTAVRT